MSAFKLYLYGIEMMKHTNGKELKIGSNCTFMELKCSCEGTEIKWRHSSNCTFMELKFDRRQRNERSHRVLIVPLWN